MLRTCTVELKSTAPYSQSRRLDEEEIPFLEKESQDDYDRRNWRHKATVDENGVICIPGMALKMGTDTAVGRLGLKVTEKGRATYTKYFKSGVTVEANIPLGMHIDEVEMVSIWANAQGRRGAGSRVKRRFPYIPEWKGTAVFFVLDPIIPGQILEKVLHENGRFVGIGRFRPEKMVAIWVGFPAKSSSGKPFRDFITEFRFGRIVGSEVRSTKLCLPARHRPCRAPKLPARLYSAPARLGSIPVFASA